MGNILARRMIPAIVLLATVVFAFPIARSEEQDDDPILNGLTGELDRSASRLVMKDFEKPYFISYRLTDVKSLSVRGSYGALEATGGDSYRGVAVDVRVGDYKEDNTSDDEGFYYDPHDDDAYEFARAYAPVDNDITAMRQKLWLLTDYHYKRALEDYIGKRGRSIQKVTQEDQPEDFSRIEPVKRLDPVDSLRVDRKRWENLVRAISARFKAQPLIYNSSVDFKAISQARYLVTTEGTRIRTGQHNYSMAISADVRADDGMPLELERVFKSHHYGELPDSNGLVLATDSLIDLLLALRAAPVMEPYTGPAIIKSGASGVFFHEGLGHRLEGHRTRRESEGHTFKDKVGSRIIPDFLSVYDDPTADKVGKTELYGKYDFDEEGVIAQRVSLVEKGILKGFLMSRTPTKTQKVSNGHGRADIWSRPVSRMGSLFVSSAAPVSYAALRKQLVDECRKAGKDYGLIFEEMVSGETNTASAGVQTLKVRPRVVRKLFVKDGHEELVRGVELIGTPLNLLENIKAAGDDAGVFNGVCGAESGWVPVSAIAPSVLIREVEVQKTDRNLKRPPILPPPLHDPAK